MYFSWQDQFLSSKLISLRDFYGRLIMIKKITIAALLTAGFSFAAAGPAFAGCKKSSAEGWGPTKELAQWQAQDMLLLGTGNLIVQTDKMSKPSYKCSSSLLGWTCTASAKVCKK